MKLWVDFKSDGISVSNGDYFCVAFPSTYFFTQEILQAYSKAAYDSGNNTVALAGSTTVIGGYYIEEDASTFKLYVVFNDKLAGNTNFAGFVSLEMHFDLGGTDLGDQIDIEFKNSEGTDAIFTYSALSPGQDAPPSTYDKYGELLFKDDLDENRENFYTWWEDILTWGDSDPDGWCDLNDSHVMSWYIYVNSEIKQAGSNYTLNTIPAPKFTDALGTYDGTGNDLHNYIFPNGYNNILGFVVYEYGDYANDYYDGDQDDNCTIYTNLLVSSDEIWDSSTTNSYGDIININDFVTMASDGKSATFDFSVFADSGGKLDKAYCLNILTIPNTPIDEDDEEDLEYLVTNIYNSVVTASGGQSMVPVWIENVTGSSGAFTTDIGSLSISKTDLYDNIITTSSAKFKLYKIIDTSESHSDPANLKFIMDIETANGMFTSGQLMYGTYILEETQAPSGYELGGTTEIEIGSATVSQSVKNTPTPLAVTKPTIKIEKVDSVTNQPITNLDSMVFELRKENSTGAFESVKELKASNSFTSDELDDGTYQLEETTPPDGYEVASGTVEFEVTAGVISVTSGNTAFTFPLPAATNPLVVTVKNTKTPSGGNDTTSLTVEKVWVATSGTTLPASVEVQLLENGAFKQTATLNGGNNWKKTWTGLDGSSTWTVDESNVPGYNKQILPNGTNSYTITNIDASIPVPSINLEVNKEWVDNNDINRPTSVTVQLLKDGVVDKTVTLNDSNNWTESWTGLDGLSIWTVDEPNVPSGYKKQISPSANGYTITNTLQGQGQPQTTSLTANKIWDDGDNRDRIRPSSVQVELLANGASANNVPNNIVALDKTNGWSYSWDKLDKFDSAGKLIVYSVQETPVPGYTATVVKSQNSANSFIITNKHTPDKIIASGGSSGRSSRRTSGRSSSISDNIIVTGIPKGSVMKDKSFTLTPVPSNVTVEYDETYLTMRVNEDGSITFTALKDGQTTITFSRPGYPNYDVIITIVSSKIEPTRPEHMYNPETGGDGPGYYTPPDAGVQQQAYQMPVTGQEINTEPTPDTKIEIQPPDTTGGPITVLPLDDEIVQISNNKNYNPLMLGMLSIAVIAGGCVTWFVLKRRG